VIETTIKCQGCKNEVKIKFTKVFEIKDILKKLGWLQFADMTLCPDCRNRPMP
jgi:hypothetical protein